MQLTIGSRAVATASCSLRSRRIAAPSRFVRAAAHASSAKFSHLGAACASRDRVVAAKASGAVALDSSESAEPTVEEVGCVFLAAAAPGGARRPAGLLFTKHNTKHPQNQNR